MTENGNLQVSIFSLTAGLADIVVHPPTQMPLVNSAVTIPITALFPLDISYQWRKDGEPIADGGNISGANSPTLSINPVQHFNAGAYDCIVTNLCGSIISQPGVLAPVIGRLGDTNADGMVNIDDLFMVINGWGSCLAPPQPCPADIHPPPSGNGVVNIDDLFMVINNWG